MRLRVGDTVRVMSGDEKGKSGRLLRILDGGGRVVIEGVNFQWKHLRKGPKHPKGGRIRREGALAACKVMPLDPESGRATRVRFQVVDGKKARVAARSGKPLPAPAKS